MLTINISGPDKSGKGHVIAAVAHALEKAGCKVLVQGSETHNATKLAKTDEEIADRLTGVQIRITEQQTSL